MTNKPFAKYWIHHGLLTINGQKMAKSLGNFITVEDALKKYSADELKMFFLFSHYASPVDFADAKMMEARKALNRFDILFWKAYEIIKKEKAVIPLEDEFITKHKTEFLKAMDDDFNSPKALASLFELLNDTNKLIGRGTKDGNYAGIIYRAVETIEQLTKNIFGLFLDHAEIHLDKEEQRLLEERREARSRRDFKRSDELREALRQKGIAVEDTKDGQTWRWL